MLVSHKDLKSYKNNHKADEDCVHGYSIGAEIWGRQSIKKVFGTLNTHPFTPLIPI
jgi:hypothetical protein